MFSVAVRKESDSLHCSLPVPSGGYDFVTRENASYPQKLLDVLGSKAPQRLYYKGNLSLLDAKAVGFCGSRNASEKGLETAKDCAGQIASEGVGVISGNAIGVDGQAHRAALQAGGGTILVLPEGIEHFRIRKELKDVWDWQRVLVLSYFSPEAPWHMYKAMERNHIIVALSDAMIVIEAGEKGGTIEAGKAALRLKRPLYVAVYDDMASAPGNDELLRKGAKKLLKSSTRKKASLTTLLAQIESGAIIPSATEQAQPSFL